MDNKKFDLLDKNNNKANTRYMAYLLEKCLAQKIKNSTNDERLKAYNSAYQEYYKTFPDHPFQKKYDTQTRKTIKYQFRYLKKYLCKKSIFLEIGSGTGDLASEAAKIVKKVIMLDVSKDPTKGKEFNSNMQLVIYNGVSLPILRNSVDIVYSSHVIEHLHPDDAVAQIKSIHSVLNERGNFICVTPHRFSGPHDISKGFDEIASCFHIKEYTVSELSNLFKKAGFKKIKYIITCKGVELSFPICLIKILEIVLDKCSYSTRRILASSLPLRLILSIRLLGKVENKN